MNLTVEAVYENGILKLARPLPLRNCPELTSRFRWHGTIVPRGEFIVEDDPHVLFISFRRLLARRVVSGEDVDGSC